LIVVSPSIRAWYLENIGQKNSEVILNSPFIKDNSEACDKNYLRDRFGIPSSMPIFIYVGFLCLGRGIETLLDIFSTMNSYHVIFMGYGELSSLVKQFSCKHQNIHYHDAVPHDKVVEIIKASDYGFCMVNSVSLSDYYCLPNKLFEYCFAGLPVIASDFPDIRNIVEHYGLGVCCNPDEESIRQAIVRIVKLNTASDISIDDLYDLSWEAQKNKLLHLYKRVVVL
jgi:glycosyltransferase involved in cell wall biosynthesis